MLSDEALLSERPTGLLEHLMDPGTATHRYIALSFICLFGFGNYLCYDTQGAIEKSIEDAMSIESGLFLSL